jgi:hypothetical protein
MSQTSEIKLLKRFDQNVEITGNLTIGGSVSGISTDNFYLDGITKSGNTLTFSVNGATNQTYTFGSNAFTSYTDHSTQGYLTSFDITTQTDPKYLRSNADDTMSGTLTITGSSGVSRLRIEGTTPTIDLDDSNGDSFYIHVNSNNFYVLNDRDGGGNYGDWETPYALQLEADTNTGYLFGNRILTVADEGSGNGIDADTLDGSQGSYYDHRGYTVTNNYLGGYYVSGGTEKPNSSVFGAGKLKIAMLRGGSNNLGFGGTWNDVLWMSTYSGSDVKRSTALVSSKYDNTSLWIAKQNYDSASWGTGYLIWNSGNDGSGSGLDADLLDGQHASAFASASHTHAASDITSGTFDGARLPWNSNDNFTGTYPLVWKASNTPYTASWLNVNGTTDVLHTRGINLDGNISFTGDSRRIDLSGGTTSSQNALIIGEQNVYGVRFRWDSGSALQFDGYWNSSTTGAENRDLGYIDVNNRIWYLNQRVQANESLRSPQYYDSNNTGYYIHGDGTSRLNILNVNAVGTSVGGIGKVMFPYGAEYNSGSTTGAIKITLPQSWTNTMMTMKITIFDYSINESFEVHCGGYNYAGGGGYWVNTHAKIIANGGIDRNFNVRFGHDGSKCCIIIGETSSSWSYPKVVVTEWVGGHSNETFHKWDNGWDISIVTTLPSNIDQTRSNNQIGRYQKIIYDTDDTGYFLDPATAGNGTVLNGVKLNYLGVGTSANTSGNYRINMSGSIDMNANNIDYVNQLHFNDNVRFYDDGNDNYLNFKYGDGNNGGIKFLNGSTAQKGYLYAADSGFGLLSANGTWAVRTTDSGTFIDHRTDSPIYYDSDNTAYYINGASTSSLNALNATRIGVNPSGSSTSRYGISLYAGYNSGEPTYGLLFTGTSLGTHGAVTSDWATYFTMNNNTSRGWIFRRVGSGNCASISAGGTASFNGDVIAYYSDMRLKTKLGDIKDPIGKIQALNGFYYEPNEVAESYGYEKETRVGLSAQEVEAVLPEIVTDAPIGDGYKTVDYAKLVPVLVEAIKEQQKQIDELKSLINK